MMEATNMARFSIPTLRLACLASLAALAATAEEPAGEAAAGFSVPFGFARETVDETGIAELTSIARAFTLSGAGAASIAGHTDTAGDAGANMALSERRAALVRREMIVRGVPSVAIETAAFGETRPVLDTGDGVREAANRRAEVAVLVPGSRPIPDPLTPYSFPLPPQAPQD
jgi:outer membrane protein OmpA-like peptidoglycan-associated protein